MQHSNARIRTGEEGYTLVELLVVLAILGLLVAIATPQVLKYLDRSKVSVTRTQVESLSSAVDLFRLDVGRYPSAEEGLQSLVTAPPTATGWSGPYLKKASSLIDPWGHTYKYRIPGQHGAFDVYSDGPDGGGHGDTAVMGNW